MFTAFSKLLSFFLNEEEDTQEADADSEKSQQERGNIKSQFYILVNNYIYASK